MKGKIKIWMVGLALVALGGVALAQSPGNGFRGQGNCVYGVNRVNVTAGQAAKIGTYGPGIGFRGGQGFRSAGRMGYGPCGGGFHRSGYGPRSRF